MPNFSTNTNPYHSISVSLSTLYFLLKNNALLLLWLGESDCIYQIALLLYCELVPCINIVLLCPVRTNICDYQYFLRMFLCSLTAIVLVLVRVEHSLVDDEQTNATKDTD